MIALRQRDVVNLTYDPYQSSGTRSGVVIDGMKTPNHPNVGRIYSIVTVTKTRVAGMHHTTGPSRCRKTGRKRANRPSRTTLSSRPGGTFNVTSKDIAGQHTRLDDSGMKRILLAFKRMTLEDIN